MGSLKELVEFLAKSIVGDPSQVHVSEIEGAAAVILELRVGPEDGAERVGLHVGAAGGQVLFLGAQLGFDPAAEPAGRPTSCL